MDSRSLIFDIGANNGADAAFYLKKGFRVVAVEPMPEPCAAIRDRLAEYIAAGQLAVEPVAIASAPGQQKLYLSRFSEWSSLMANNKNTGEWGAGVLNVQAVTIDELIARYGRPYYIKIDIEGTELNAISGYGRSGELANYVSIEVNDDWEVCCEKLQERGYRSFQLVRQGKDFLPPPPFPAREGEYVSQVFENAMSGLFGRELPGKWISLPTLRHVVAEMRREQKARRARGERAGWHDVHASLHDTAAS